MSGEGKRSIGQASMGAAIGQKRKFELTHHWVTSLELRSRRVLLATMTFGEGPTRAGWGLQQNVMVDLRHADRTLSYRAMPLHCPGAKRSGAAAPWPS